MKMTAHFPPTRRSAPKDLSPGHALLEQAGYIRQVGTKGVYSLLPLGFRVHRRICDIVYDEMEDVGVQHLQLPIIQARSLWEQTGRWEKYRQAGTMFVTEDQHSHAQYGLAPTAEEAVTALAAAEVTSWRQLPLILHQIGPKFRDEVSPRNGLLRGLEFVMSDAYSFDVDADGMRQSYALFRDLYYRIFKRVGLPSFIAVQADSGPIGGSGSTEFMALTDSSQGDILLACTNCDYAANVEKAQAVIPAAPYDEPDGAAMSIEHTPNVGSVEELQVFFPDIPATRMLKTFIVTVDRGLSSESRAAVFIRADLEVQETKLANALGAQSVVQATPEEVIATTQAEVGFAGPIGLERVSRAVYDESTRELRNFLCGVNRTDYHAINVNFGTEALPYPSEESIVSVAAAASGFLCPICRSGTLTESRGIEIGHIFMLQQSYAAAFNMSFLPDTGKGVEVPWMGCYGIGTSRLVQAVAEQCRDEKGLVWPAAIAPFAFHIVVAKLDGPALAVANEVYALLKGRVLMDDRPNVSAGVKFNDAELIGIPQRLTIGRRVADGIIEVTDRATGTVREVSVADIREGALG